MLFAAEFGTGQVLWSVLWIFLFVLWFWLVVTVFADIIRARDLSGWAKALWVVAIIVLPYLGVLIYLIVNGDKMNERDAEAARAAEEAAQAYIRHVAGTPASQADELAKLAELHRDGALTDSEYTQAKAGIVGG